MSETLTMRDRAVLFTLMGEVRPLTNTELRQRGLDLGPRDRERLQSLRLVRSDLSTRPHVHTLDDEGWAWCARELSSRVPTGRTGPAGHALYAVLAGMGRFMAGADLHLSDVFRPDQERSLRDAYRGLVRRPGDHILLSRLREELPDVTRTDLDATLTRMSRLDGVHLVPESNQQSLTDADRDAALRLAGQVRHLLAIEAL